MYRFLNRILAVCLAVGASLTAFAEAPDAADAAAPVVSIAAVAAAPAQNSASEFEPLAARRWEYGPFVNLGSGLEDRFGYYFFALGYQMGRNLTPVIHAGPLSGRFEFGGNIMPVWQSYTPAPYKQVVTSGTIPITQQIGGGPYYGLSITPVVFRWNFATASPRLTPWFQAAAGAVYTTHKYPPTVEVPEGTPGGTSVFNFRSGAGIGFHYFTRPRRSLDFALNAEHLSSASLGDKNPGVNASLQFQLGYTWWK